MVLECVESVESEEVKSGRRMVESGQVAGMPREGE